MSFQEKRTVVSLLTGIALIAAYSFFSLRQYASGALSPNDLVAWSKIMLIFIGIGVVAAILAQILFHILFAMAVAVAEKQKAEPSSDEDVERRIKVEAAEDEMGKEIGLRASRIGSAITGLGFLAALVSLALGGPPALMLNVLFFAFFVGSSVEGIAQLLFYRKGLRNG